MYHGFTDGNKESDYVLNIKKFEEDIVHLKKQGFTFVDTDDIINYVYTGKKLPEKSVMLTFDDGYLNNYIYAFPVIKKHGVKAVISPIAYYVEYYTLNHDKNPDYSHLTDKEIKEMHESGFIDFQNHSYNMHSLKKRKGSLKLTEEDTHDYIREFYYDLKAAENVIEDITGKKTIAYAYPFGSVSKESVSILKCCGYKVSFGCEEGFNYLTTGDKNSLLKLKRFNRTPKRSAEQIISNY
ncbi:MAG: polysaccharide deacetylase family protein [Clostridia bacterium]|nr:polysaccharide deacetylase family protein [Clostridia bacterium]MBO7288552.1 polysaccharide deacetylase family protein [Clostridia bacterium]